jgi:hypothetical protein
MNNTLYSFTLSSGILSYMNNTLYSFTLSSGKGIVHVDCIPEERVKE